MRAGAARRSFAFPMFTLFLFAMVVGGALLLVSALSGDANDGDVSQGIFEWLSLRTLTYFLFVFGGVGAVLARSWSAAAAPIVFVVALAAGIGVAAAASLTFGYLRRTSSGDRNSDESFVGLTGRVSVPLPPKGTGKVMVERGDRTFELLARPLDGSAGDPSRWQSIVIVEMRRGVAFVAPSDDPRVQDISLLNP